MVANNQPATRKIIYILWIALVLNVLMLVGNIILVLPGDAPETFREFVRSENSQWVELFTDQLKNLSKKVSILDQKIQSGTDNLGNAQETKRIFDSQMGSSVKLINNQVAELEKDLEACWQKIEQIIIIVAQIQEQSKMKSK